MIYPLTIFLIGSGSLTVLYIFIFTLDKRVLNIGNNFQTPAILTSCVAIISITLTLIASTGLFGIYELIGWGIAIFILAEVFLLFYKNLLIKLSSKPEIYIPSWYISISLIRNLSITVSYGIAISLPVSLQLTINNPMVTWTTAFVFVFLFFVRKPVLKFFRKLYGEKALLD